MIFASEFPSVRTPMRSVALQFVERMAEHSRLRGEEPALINAHDHSDAVTYGQLHQHSLAVAAFLRAHGFARGDVAAAVMPNRWEYAPVLAGVTLSGGALSGASALFTVWELSRQFADCGAKVVFADSTVLSKVLEAAATSPRIEMVISIGPNALKLNRIRGEAIVFDFSDVLRTATNGYVPTMGIDMKRDLVLIPYSSGTTGTPKGVMISHYNLSAMLAMLAKHTTTKIYPAIDAKYNPTKETTLFVLPFYHCYGVTVLLHLLMEGSTGVVMQKFEPELFLRSIQDFRIRIQSAVPPMILFMAKHPLVERFDLSSLLWISSGAAPLGKDLIEELMRRLPNLKFVRQGYGMTEMTMASHMSMPTDEESVASVGKLAPNMEMKITDVSTGQNLPANKAGEICVRGPTIMVGYLNRPDETQSTFDNEGFLRTGDIGFVDDKGFVFVVDRLKELIKVRGFQVPPAELEDLILSHPKVEDCAVIGVKDQRSGELPKAFVVPKPQSNLNEADIIRFVEERVAHFKHLKGGVEFIAAIPRSPAGKILRRGLRDAHISDIGSPVVAKL